MYSTRPIQIGKVYFFLENRLTCKDHWAQNQSVIFFCYDSMNNKTFKDRLSHTGISNL